MLRQTFTIQAEVVLLDHLHRLRHLPPGNKVIPATESRRLKGEREVWQRRFWEHLIWDDKNCQRHVDNMHYNPVKHGVVRAPVEWKYSSFHDDVKQGLYPSDWWAGEALEIDLGARMG